MAGQLRLFDGFFISKGEIMELVVFQNEGWNIRTVNENGEVWFAAKDVAEALGYARPEQAILDKCKGSVKRVPLETAGGIQQVRVIQESDVYRLIVNSKLPTAERFENWVMEEVLPSIRKTGGYLATNETSALAQSITALAQSVQSQTAFLLSMSQRLDRLENREDAKIEWFTIIAWGKIKFDRALTTGEAMRLGRKASAISREMGLEIKTTQHSSYGTVNKYHVSALEKLEDF